MKMEIDRTGESAVFCVVTLCSSKKILKFRRNISPPSSGSKSNSSKKHPEAGDKLSLFGESWG
jgi:hypothetical protein